MNVGGHLIEESGSFGSLRAGAFGAAEQRARCSPQSASDLLDGRQRRIPSVILDCAEVIRREPSTLSQLLQREPQSPAVASDTRTKRHDVEFRGVMRADTTIKGVDQSILSCCHRRQRVALSAARDRR